MTLHQIFSILTSLNQDQLKNDIENYINSDKVFFTLENVVVMINLAYKKNNIINLYYLSKEIEKNGLII